MNRFAFPLGTLIWTSEAPRPIETLQAGDTILAFNPETFSRVPVVLQQVQVQEQMPTRRLEVGGRVVMIEASQPCPVFDLDGEWRTLSAPQIKEGDLLPVDRLVPVPANPIALPLLDERITQLFGEDPLALSDALYNSTDYFREMEKRELRLRFYELLGDDYARSTSGGYAYGYSDDRGRDLTIYYSETFFDLFGDPEEIEDWDAFPNLGRWVGDTLTPRDQRALPPWIWSLNNLGISAFVRGFFDALGKVTGEKITVTHPSLAMIAGIQMLLGRIHIESLITYGGPFPTPPWYRLAIRNVRRFAEWVNSNVTEHRGILKAVYTREARYPSDSTAHLPLNVIRPALERIRNRHTFPTRTHERADEGEITKIETLRLLATAFNDTELRDAVNQQLYLEPVTNNITADLDTLFILSVVSPATIIANGVVVGGKEIRVKREA